MSIEGLIGKNIKDVRTEKSISQKTLAAACEFSDTTLSAYENGRKTPNLITIAKIANQLNVSIDRLCYGDENSAFIDSAPDQGRKIVNAIYCLWSMGVIEYYKNLYSDIGYLEYCAQGEPEGIYLKLLRFRKPIKRLLASLNEFRTMQETYQDGAKYLEMLLSSVATEINNELKEEEKIGLYGRK